MLQSEDPLAHGQQCGELIPGGGRVARLPGPAGKFVPGVQSVGVLRAEGLLEHGQQPGVLVPGSRRVPRLPRPESEVAASG